MEELWLQGLLARQLLGGPAICLDGEILASGTIS